MAMRRVLCGSSVYVQKKWSWSLTSMCSVVLTVSAPFVFGELVLDRTLVAVAVLEAMIKAVTRNTEFSASKDSMAVGVDVSSRGYLRISQSGEAQPISGVLATANRWSMWLLHTTHWSAHAACGDETHCNTIVENTD
jgi:hypothetical protein